MPTPTPGLIVEYEHGGAHFAVATADGYPATALCEVSSDQYGRPLHLVATYTADELRTPRVTCPKCVALVSAHNKSVAGE